MRSACAVNGVTTPMDPPRAVDPLGQQLVTAASASAVFVQLPDAPFRASPGMSIQPMLRSSDGIPVGVGEHGERSSIELAIEPSGDVRMAAIVLIEHDRLAVFALERVFERAVGRAFPEVNSVVRQHVVVQALACGDSRAFGDSGG